MRRLETITLLLFPVLFAASGCAAFPKNMPFRFNAKGIDFSEGSVVAMGLDLDNTINEDVEPVARYLFVESVETGKEYQFSTRISFDNVPLTRKAQEAMSPEKQILSGQLPIGVYRVTRIDGMGKWSYEDPGFWQTNGASCGIWTLEIGREFEIREDEVLYLGQIRGNLVPLRSEANTTAAGGSASGASGAGLLGAIGIQRSNKKAGFSTGEFDWQWINDYKSDLKMITGACPWFDASLLKNVSPESSSDNP